MYLSSNLGLRRQSYFLSVVVMYINLANFVLLHFADSSGQEKAEELLGMMRDTILSDNSSAKTRCLLLEMLEFHARQGKISSKVEDYFSDKLAEIMANEL